MNSNLNLNFNFNSIEILVLSTETFEFDPDTYLRFTELEISLRFKIIKTCQRSIDGYRFRPIPIFGTDRF